MKKVIMKAAQFILRQYQKESEITREEQLIPEVDDLRDKWDKSRYYSGILSMPSITAHMYEKWIITSTSDEECCQVPGPQSYGKMFKTAFYDTKNHVCLLVFPHSVGTDLMMPIFQALKSHPGFDVKRQTIIWTRKSPLIRFFIDNGPR